MWHGILNFFGIINEGGKGYAFWSGFGADFSEIAILSAIYAIYRRHNCHVQRCWRIQRHAVEGTPWIVCRKHHPTIDRMPEAGDLHSAAVAPPVPQPATATRPTSALPSTP